MYKKPKQYKVKFLPIWAISLIQIAEERKQFLLIVGFTLDAKVSYCSEVVQTLDWTCQGYGFQPWKGASLS